MESPTNVRADSNQRRQSSSTSRHQSSSLIEKGDHRRTCTLFAVTAIVIMTLFLITGLPQIFSFSVMLILLVMFILIEFMFKLNKVTTEAENIAQMQENTRRRECNDQASAVMMVSSDSTHIVLSSGQTILLPRNNSLYTSLCSTLDLSLDHPPPYHVALTHPLAMSEKPPSYDTICIQFSNAPPQVESGDNASNTNSVPPNNDTPTVENPSSSTHECERNGETILEVENTKR